MRATLPPEDLPLFAWGLLDQPERVTAPASPPPPVRIVRGRKQPAPPPADTIWKPRAITFDMAALAFAKAVKRERPAPKPITERITDAVLACPKIAFAIGQPDIAPPSLDFRSAAWVQAIGDKISLELAYQGPKAHLADAIDALSRLSRDLGLLARTSTAQISPLRADTAKRGQIGWRATVAMVPAHVVRTQEAGAYMAA